MLSRSPAAPRPYQLVERWSPLAAPGSPEWELGGVAISGDGRRLVLARRVDAPLLEVDPARGVITRQWANGLIAWSHSLTFDREGNLWVADAAIGSDARTGLNPAIPSAVAAGRGHQVLKLGRDGQVRLALGTAQIDLFSGARLSRRFFVTMAKDASLTLFESTVFGRVAMGERVTEGLFRDHWRIRREGRLVFADEIGRAHV